ncbi:DEAD/DEAH box helicase [Nannocystis sp.]|uniref:DEAD/DEAH box helicase n=1 Tax=Nannocystis sp. TaxID=1962667 RepID=UPI0025ED67BE|nr:DEAD/DEAH box helicase [Nannocystis sp.]
MLARDGHLLVLADGEQEITMLRWQARTGETPTGERLLRLAVADDQRSPAPLPDDLAFGRALARAALRELAAAHPREATPGEPGPGVLPELLATAPAALRRGLSERALLRAWHEVCHAARRELARPDAAREAFFRRHGVDPDQDRMYLHVAERKHDRAYPFAFLVTVAQGRGPHGRTLHVPLAAALQQHVDDPQARQRLLAPLRRAASLSPIIRALVESGEVYHPVAWTAAQAHALLCATAELEDSGLRIRVPDWWHQQAPSPQVRVELGATQRAPSGAPNGSQLGIGALLDFRLRYFLGDDELTPEEWRALMGGAAGLHHLRGRWIELDPARHAEALRHWQSIAAAAGRGQISFAEGMRLLAGLPRGSLTESTPAAWTVATPGPWLATMLAELQSPRGSPETDPGPALHGTLRPYQRDGVAWLWLLMRLGLGGCLADDMGLGKTIQVIALLLLMRKHKVAGPHLIVLPASLLGNWRAELARFGPSLRVYTAHRSVNDGDAPKARVDVVLTTYATLQRQPWLKDQAWGLVVLDEAQAIKNAQAKQTHAVKALHCRHRLILTGTPVENSLTDLWSLFDFGSPGLLGASGEFKAFVRRLGSDHAGLAPLRALVRPYILRRLKTDRRVITDLPDKTELQVYCGLTRGQAALYQKAVDALASEVQSLEGIRRRGVILAYLTRFKQICNHPSHYSGDGQYVPEDSAKFLRLQELCAQLAEVGEKVLVFTQFREVCAPIAALLEATFGRPGLVLHGGTPIARRSDMVAEFQQGDGPPFMVLSLKAGGTGLNLTAAGHVVHFDRWWNPAVENQATDRAYRIGQHKNVLVHKFVCRGTLEEKIDAMLRDKQGLADGVLADDGEHRLTELSTDELLRVVSLDLRAALAED